MTRAILGGGGGYLKWREMQDKLQITVIAKIWSNVAALYTTQGIAIMQNCTQLQVLSLKSWS